MTRERSLARKIKDMGDEWGAMYSWRAASRWADEFARAKVPLPPTLVRASKRKKIKLKKEIYICNQKLIKRTSAEGIKRTSGSKEVPSSIIKKLKFTYNQI